MFDWQGYKCSIPSLLFQDNNVRWCAAIVQLCIFFLLTNMTSFLCYLAYQMLFKFWQFSHPSNCCSFLLLYYPFSDLFNVFYSNYPYFTLNFVLFDPLSKFSLIFFINFFYFGHFSDTLSVFFRSLNFGIKVSLNEDIGGSNRRLATDNR